MTRSAVLPARLGWIAAVTVSVGCSHLIGVASAAAPAAGPPSVDRIERPEGADFDADGYADLIIGASQDENSGGSVTVLYGSPTGATTNGRQYWTQDTRGIPDSEESSDGFGASVSWGDYDGDGFDDLAIGVPFEELDHDGQGAIQILYGSTTGLSTARESLLDESVAGRDPAPDRDFGRVLTTGDFDGDGFADLVSGNAGAFGAPYGEAVEVMYGSPGGLDGARADYIDEEVLGAIGGYSLLGRYLATGDIDGDGVDELAIGLSGDYDGHGRPGAVYVLPGSAAGLKLDAAEKWWQGSPGVPGQPESSDAFGVVVMGDFDADGFADLAIGAPYDEENDVVTTSVTVLYGTARGTSAQRAQRFDQLTPGVGGRNELTDRLGDALCVGDFNGDGADDLAAGNPSESLKSDGVRVGQAGDVLVLYGGVAGLSVNGRDHWNQDSRKIKDQAEQGDSFGQTIAAADHDGDGFSELVVAAVDENSWSGVVHVLRGDDSGVTRRGNELWSQDSRRLPTPPRALEYFGSALG